MSIFSELLQYAKAKAIGDFFQPNEESIYRDACRVYSKTFHTELEKVFTLDPEKVLLAVYEEQLNDLDIDEHLETLLEQIYRIENPTYDQDKEEDLQQYIQQVQKQEYEKTQTKKESSKNSLLETTNPIPDHLPKSGSFDVSKLGKNEG